MRWQRLLIIIYYFNIFEKLGKINTMIVSINDCIFVSITIFDKFTAPKISHIGKKTAFGMCRNLRELRGIA